MDSLLETLNGTSPDRAQQQLDALRDALEVRLSALEAALADPARGESLEGLIVELARVATEEAQAAALKVSLDAKLEAEARVVQARAVAQEATDEERAANAELRRVVEQGRQRVVSLEQEQLARMRTLREELEAELARERAASTGLERAVSETKRQLQAERAVSADLRAAAERAAADAQRRIEHGAAGADQQLQAERAISAELRAAVERAHTLAATLEREKSQAWTAQEALTANLVRERETAAAAERANVEAQSRLEEERAVSAGLRRAVAHAEQQLSEAVSGHERLSVSRSEVERERDALRAEAGAARIDADTARAEADAARIDADTARAEADAARVDADAARAEANAARIDADTARAEANAARVDAVAARAEADATRIDADAVRAEADATRIDADAVRAEADATRIDADTARAALVAAGARLEMLDTERLRTDHSRQDLDVRLEALRVERDALAAELQVARQFADPSREPRAGNDTLPPPIAPAPSPFAAALSLVPLPTPDAGEWGRIRLAVRHAFREPVEVQINGDIGVLIDLSIAGCQLVSSSAVKPNQVVKVLLPASETPIACTGKVMWARFEPRGAGQSIGYRAGVHFTKPDQQALEAFVAARA